MIKLWRHFSEDLLQNLAHGNFPQTNERAQTPLLDNNSIADLRERALGIIDYQSKNKAVLHRQHGEHVSPRRGYGLDYEESRVYQPGDEVRFMNWRLTARTGEPHIKVFLEERRPSGFILLDARYSMRFGTRVRLKLTQALRAATLLAFYNYYCGRSVSGLIIDDEFRWLASSSDEQGVLGMISRMNRVCPPTNDVVKQMDFPSTLRAIQSALTSGTQLFLISDFLDVTDDCQAMLAQLAAEHEVSAIHIVDPAEQQLPNAGNLPFVDATNETRRVNTSDVKLAESYQQAAQQHLMSRENLLRGLGITYVRLNTTVDNIETEIVFS